MENFLNDYGLKWIGYNKDHSDNNSNNPVSKDSKDSKDNNQISNIH